MGRIVVVGAGLAGLRAAQGARSAGHEGALTIVGDESLPPYTRPPLSKAALTGEQAPEDCTFPGLDALDAELRLGVAVTALDADGHAVTLSDATTLGYDRLILATGARARRLPEPDAPPPAPGPRSTPGPERSPSPTLGAVLDTSPERTPSPPGVHTLRDLADAARLRAALRPGTHLAIVGAGFVGCEVAASARALGVEVTLIDVAEQPLAPLGPELGARCAQLHRNHGVELRLGAGVRGLTADATRGTGVVLADGAIVFADHVLVALGARPNTEFLDDGPLELADDGGVVCDATLTSVSDPDVLAAGDIAAWPHAGANGERVRVEHWTTAAEHGRIAGQNAVLDPAQRAAHVAPPYFWSDQYDCRIQSVGFPARATQITIVEQDTVSDADGSERLRLVAEALDSGGELIGAIAFNHARRLAEYRRRLVVEHA